jgi:dGTP triphosphohydrolase
MSQPELLEYKNALSSQRFTFDDSEVSRIASESNKGDLYVSAFEGVIDPFIIDKTKIKESKAARRLLSKTQVVFNPDSPHIRTRASHTEEVSSVAVNISNILGLNDNLTEAIALGHDIGHAPSGHLYEGVVEQNLGIEFKHEIFSAIIAVFIERKGCGLNLTEQTLNGILNHSQSSNNHLTQEARIVMYSDKIAYIAADIKDLQRINFLSPSDLDEMHSIFPIDSPYVNNQRLFITTCIKALVEESAKKGFISFEDSQVAQNFKALKKCMYGHYNRLDSKLLNEIVSSVINEISNIKDYDPILLTALMTDSEIRSLYQKLTCSRRINLDDIANFGVGEIIRDMDLQNQSYQGFVTRLHQKISF